jgi:hypothetical protein
LAACENDQTAAVAVVVAAAVAAPSSVPGRGVPTMTAENSVSKSSSDILGSPVMLIFFCMSVCLLICLFAIITINIEKYFNFSRVQCVGEVSSFFS